MWTAVRLLLTTTARPCPTPAGPLRPLPCLCPAACPLTPCRRTTSNRTSDMSSQSRAESSSAASGGAARTTATPARRPPKPRLRQPPSDRVAGAENGLPTPPLANRPPRDKPKRKTQTERQSSAVSLANPPLLNTSERGSRKPRNVPLEPAKPPQRNSQQKKRQTERKLSPLSLANQSSWNSPKAETQNERKPAEGSQTKPSRRTSPKRKRPPSESNSAGEIYGKAAQRLAASAAGQEASTAGMELLAALTRMGNMATGRQRNSDRSSLQPSERTVPTVNQKQPVLQSKPKPQGVCEQTAPTLNQQQPVLQSKPKPQGVCEQTAPTLNQQQPGLQSKPKPQVSGEEMLERCRVWEPVTSEYQTSVLGPLQEFTMVSYNVLSQHLHDLHPDLYVDAPQEDAAWEVRGPRLWAQLVGLRPDIVCLQEIDEGDIETFWRPRCKQEGFNVVYKKRTGRDKVDGCAVLYRESVFSLRELATVEYLQPDCRALDRDNVGVVVRLGGAGGDLVVACTHLLYNPKRHDVKLAQVALLLAEVDRLAWCGRQQTYLPVLLAGDLNLEPFSPVYQFLCSGWLQYGGLSRRKLTPFGGGEQLVSPLLPPELGVSAFCRHAAVQLRRLHRPAETEAERRRAERRLLAVRHSERRHPPPPLPLQQLAQEAAAGYLAHGLRLGSVYRHGTHRGPEVTTRQRQWVTVDYIFQSVSPPPGSVRLELTSRLALPTASVCERLRPYPSVSVPSDHLPLAARFRLVPGVSWWPGQYS